MSVINFFERNEGLFFVKMLSNSFQVNYVMVGPRNARFTLRHGKSEERAYYLGIAYGYDEVGSPGTELEFAL